ncbi:MAG TPA: pseudouridine synthase [Ohtaekwangia sp.]
MPRRNPSGQSGKRKPSSSRSDSSGERSFSRRSSADKSGSFKKKSSGYSDRGQKPAGRSFKKSDNTDSKKPFARKSEGFGENRFDKGEKGSFKKPFKKFDSDSPRPFRRKSDDESGDRKFSSRGDNSSRPFKKPFKKFDSDSPKPFRRKSEGEFGDKKFSSRKDDERPFKKPFKKFDTDSPKPFRRKSEEGSGDKKFSSRKENNSRSFKKPFRDSDKKDSFRKRDSTDSRSDRKPRSFEKPFRKSEESADGFRKERPRKSFREKPEEDHTSEAPAQTEKIRLNRFIANSGVCSRREADNLITMGLISVNGKTITELGFKVNPGDEVRYESKVLRAEKPVYVLLNKPKGFLTTTSDPQERNTVMHLLGNHIKERIYPVGRLDRNTTGLLLLTNDGDLADKLMHPSYNVKKIYKVELDRPLTKADYQKILDGVHLEEGKAQVDDLAIVSDDNKTIGIELHIGWNRVVRRIFESLQYEVVRLDRSVYAGLDKKDLGRGEWRFLKKEEVVRLKHYK